MNIITYCDVIVYYLKKDYKEKSDILNNLSLHIDNLYDNYVLTTDDKKKLNTLISETINNLNNYYNNIYSLLYPDIINETKVDINFNLDIKRLNLINKDKYFCNENDFNIFIETLDILKENNCIEEYYKDLNIVDFKEINIRIKKICNYVGLSNIKEIVNLYGFNNIIKLNNEENNKIKILNDLFVPFKCKYIEDKRIDKRNKYFEFIHTKNVDDKYSLLLGNVYQIKFRLNKFKTVLEITGFMKNDSINSYIRTSQLCNDFIYNKKKLISDELNKINEIDKFFKQSYVKNLSIGDLFVVDEVNIKKQINDDYIKYIKYSNMIFKSIMNDFINSDIIIKFEIIKFLLLGSSTSINIAALLFGITKDHKESIDNNSKPTIISDLIYKNLKFISQVKLKKSDTNMLEELEKISSVNSNDIDLKKQIITNKNMPDYVKKIAIQKLEETKYGSSENYKHIDYVKTLIEYPWIGKNYTDIFSTLNNDIDSAKDFMNNSKIKMNQIIYGHDKCKETMIELIAKWISNPKSIGKCIGLNGPPGVGKTLFGKALGDILGIPFAQINVGGIDDASVLSGHSFTYSNAQPGLIIRKMIQAGSPRCIIFIDEIDKTGIKYGINEIMNILIHITDPNTNDNFNDKFFQEVTFPLSKVLFIFSYNDQSKIDKILLDRIEQINVEAYSTIEKINIFKNYLLKEILNEVNFNNDLIKFEDKAIEHLIETYTYEAGVRGLKRKLEKILLKINLDKIYSNGVFENNKTQIDITVELIDKLLDKSNINIKKILPKPYSGIINGLYATDSGIGGILPILIYRNCNGTGKFKLKLTGSQKTVMQESIEFSFTIATNLLLPTYVDKFIKDNSDGLHIHTPDGATPKDGPSAGAAFTTAFISKILDKKIKNNIAMTGEIETNGAITAIGGLESKLNGAKKAGVELVFVPKENEKDYEKILKKNNKLIDKNFNVIIVENIYDVLQYALIDVNKKYKVNDKTFDCKKYFIYL
jgi:endopeptidase La